MATWRKGRIEEFLEYRSDVVRARVDVDGDELIAVGFPSMIGEVAKGDMVILNTTGLDLDLGSGGVAFMLWNLDNRILPQGGEGHIVKLRYTPWQTEVLASEAPESPHHTVLRELTSIDGMPVVACGLHSQVAGVAAGIKAAAPGARVGYLMTDGAALPMAWSDLVRALTGAGLVDVTCTAGHAFGGDLESVNVFSGLAALRAAGKADAAVVAMGPGVVGTGTVLGHTALEQGPALDAAVALGGKPVACLRISFTEGRGRHRGVSHHSLTALMVAARESCEVAVPRLPVDQAAAVAAELEKAGVASRHKLVEADGRPGIALLGEHGVEVSSMGRSLEEVPELFAAAGAAGAVAAAHL